MNLSLSLLRSLVLSLVCSWCLSITVLAAETPSEWEPNFYYDDLEDLTDDELLAGIYSEVMEISDSLYGPGATSSEYSDSMEGEAGVSDGETLVVYADDVDSLPLADVSPDAYANSVRYDIQFNNRDYILLFNPEDIDSLYIDSQDRLWNMSGSTISGRVVDDFFDPLDDEGIIFYLEPCLGNNFSAIHNGDFPNYMRSYYWSGGAYDRLQYTTTYGIITVRSHIYPFYESQVLQYITILLLGGVFVTLCLKNYRRY